MRAGERIDIVQFQRKGLDADGARLGDWNGDGDQVEILAKLIFLRGGEVVLEQRLAGRQPAAFEVAQNPATLALDNAWRVVVPRTGQVFNVLSVEPVGRRLVHVLAVADGQGGGA